MHLYISSSAPGIQSTVTFTPVEKDQSTLYGKTSQNSGISAKNCSFLIISEIIFLSSFLVNDTLFISWRERERSIKVIYYNGTMQRSTKFAFLPYSSQASFVFRQINQNKYLIYL